MPSEESQETQSPDTIEAINQDVAKENEDFKTMFTSFMALLQDDKQRRLFMRAIKVSNLENKKPNTWSRNSNPPYYRKTFAENLKRDIDRMMLAKEIPIKYLYANEKISKKSLQLRVNQSFMFLVEEMDTENHYYRNLRDHIVITNEENGIQLAYVEMSKGAPAVQVVFGDSASSQLKKDVEAFLEHGKPGTKFSREGLQLNPQEIIEIECELEGLSNVHGKVEHNRVLIVKLDEEQN